MKKLIALVCVLCLVGCGGTQKKQTVEIIIPAGYMDAYEFTDEAIEAISFIYSDEEISPKRNTLTIKAGAGYDSIIVMLKPVEYEEENAYEPILLTHDKPIIIDVEKGAWYKIGVAIQNPSDVPIASSVIVEDVEIRIKCRDKN